MKNQLIRDVVQTKKGILITLDDEEEYLLSIRAYSDGFYYPGKELSKEEFTQLKKASKSKKAGDYLSSLLTKNRYTYHQAYQKLSSKFSLSHQEVEALLKPYLASGVIDDLAYAKDYLETKVPLGYGRKYLETQLKQKGIKEEILKNEEVISLYDFSVDALDDLIAKTDRAKQQFTIEERKEKIFAFLLRRGYSSHEAESHIDAYFSSFSEEKKEEEAIKRQSLLVKEAEKCYNSLIRRKSEPQQLKDAFIRKLLSKGFTFSEIQSVISEKEYSFHD